MQRLCILTLILVALAAAQIQDIPSTTPANQAFVKVNENFTYTAARLVEYGTTPPATCPAPYVFFDTDAPAGQNLKYCTAANTWTDASAVGLMQIKLAGTNVGSPRSNFDIQPGSYMVSVPSDDGTNVDFPFNVDDSKIATRANVQAGASVFCNDASGSSANYTCTLNPALASYTTGMVMVFRPQTTSAAGALTVNVGPSSINIKQLDGSTDPGAGALVAGRGYLLFFDGTVFRVIAGLPGGATDPNMVTAAGTLTSNLPVIGSGSKAVSVGTVTGTGTQFVASQSPTIVTPTIASMTNAQHSHQDAAGGGTLNAAAIAAGTVGTARLGSGTANSTTFLRGDQTWATSAGVDAVDLDWVILRDDFVGRLEGAIGVSELSWNVYFPGVIAGESEHHGILRSSTAAVDNESRGFSLAPASTMSFHMDSLYARSGWDFRTVVRPNTALARYSIGFQVEVEGWGGTGMGLQMDSDLSHTNWQFRRGSTYVDTGVPFVAGNWVRIRIWSPSTGVVKMSINGTESADYTTLLPTGTLSWVMAVRANAAAVTSIDADAFAAKIPVSRW